MSFDVPVVFCVFNRPTITEKTFNAIQTRKPKHLYVVADGPRASHPADVANCKATRAIVQNISWDCAVEYDFSDDNLGCKKRISTGITGAFERYEHAIILEDDCVPHETFFDYCRDLLIHYNDNPDVMHISGSQFYDTSFTDTSYYFSRFAHVWGWATWRRAWKMYDVGIADWPKMKQERVLYTGLGLKKKEALCFEKMFDLVYTGGLDTWDFQWAYQIFKHRGFCIMPNVNLISNIGFGQDATHTQHPTERALRPVHTIMLPLTYQAKTSWCDQADALTAADQFTWTETTLFNKWSRSFRKRWATIKTFFNGR